MSRGYGGNWTFIDPFSGLAESVATSNTISTRFAFDLTVSIYTTSGTTSTLTWENSNSSANPFMGDTIADNAWSQWTSFGSYTQQHPDSRATTIDPPLGYRWGRIIRELSGASWQINVNRIER